ncbi:MAG TPA: zinc-dependent metalloprotease [Candidatus Polarisedimenticolia bacterium]|nr:zinc-dependent metalloprotease [Candidatus Polarisedimenticolia bacterium]
MSTTRMRTGPTLLAFLLAAAGLLPAPAGASTRRPGDDRKEAAAKESAAKETGGKDAGAKDDQEPSKEPTFEKAVKGARELKGLFTVHIKEEDGKYLLEVAPEQLDVTFLLNPTLVSGVGQGFLYPADMLPEYPVAFHRVGKTLQLIHRNALFRASASSTLHAPASVAAPDAIVGTAKIESQPHPERKSVLVDLGALFLNDLEGMSLTLKTLFEAPYQFDREGASIASCKAFPRNVDFETVLHFKTPEFKKPLLYAADSRSLLIRYHYSIARLPETGYRPRLADDRVGHFLAMVDDYSDDRPDEPTARYVTRWHLEKQDPKAALSEVKQPIVFYLENTIPKEYRDAVRRGVLGWNPAFEAIGFKNAMVVKEQPDDPDWDAADVRYSTLRWIVAPNAGFAQGPSRIDPYTGEIFDADIRFSADMIRVTRREFDELVTPAASGAASSPSAALLRSLRGWTSMLGPLPLEPLLSDGLDAQGAAAGRALLGAGTRPGTPAAALGYCDYARGIAEQAALGWNVLEARGLADPRAREAYIDDFITHVTLHEVGHTLGLRHNFKASGIHPYDRLQDAALTSRSGLAGSVMDYIPVNIAPRGTRQGEYWMASIGPYDRWAIEYAYKPIETDSPEGERPALQAIAARAAEPDLAYGTDEDTFAGTPKGIDPASNMWDIGGDIVAYYRGRAAIARELFDTMERRFGEPGSRYQKLRMVFSQGVGELVPAAANVTKIIGGIRHTRDHIGDPNGRPPYAPLPAARQREALAFLNKEIFGPQALRVPAGLLNKLAADRLPDIEGQIFQIDRIDLPIHTLVLAIQAVALDRLYHPITLARLDDLEARYAPGEEAFTMAEMFSSLRRAVWAEIDARRSVDSFRRNLQRKHLATLVALVVQSDPAVPEDARTLARADFLALRRGIDAEVGPGGRPLPGTGSRLDEVTRVHLDETRARITAALEAGLQRQAPATTVGPARPTL